MEYGEIFAMPECQTMPYAMILILEERE